MLRKLGAQGLRNLFPIVNGTTHRSYSKLYEPDYLAALKPEFPIYEHLNIQIKGYDFALVESYQRFLHNLGESMDLEVSDGWAIPPQRLQVQRLKPSSTIVDAEYNLTLFERTIQVSDISAPIYPTLLRLAQAGLPEGISFEVVEHRPEHDEIRYVPDRELLELKDQLEEMGGARKPRKGKK